MPTALPTQTLFVPTATLEQSPSPIPSTGSECDKFVLTQHLGENNSGLPLDSPNTHWQKIIIKTLRYINGEVRIDSLDKVGITFAEAMSSGLPWSAYAVGDTSWGVVFDCSQFAGVIN
jgi:hypothetical protein